MQRDEGEQVVIRFPLQLDDQVRVLHGPPKAKRDCLHLLQLLVLGIERASAFCNFQAMSKGERGGLGITHMQDLFDSLCFLLIMKDDTAFPLS
ncbi:hypothetical protein V6N13_089905 [Hibiscus sabdariffa]|uniref:Uncharacterized protein n=1 Tax=Hibiscus sabdariffa TaxID=183260 RepID=A0ABR2QJ01_9ROSI